ncbi:MAG: hypothetical protein KDK60_03035 [Chlamydiia bacterium]|nr:hypothetical protein [Chlamydiia bacterium]
MKIKHRSAILLSGALWLAIGVMLLVKGMHYLIDAGNAALKGGPVSPYSPLSLIGRFSKNPQQSALILLSISLILGLFKGRVMMKKAVVRIVKRVQTFENPFPIKKLYPPAYLLLIGGMMAMGMAFKYLPFPMDVKGFIDAAVGSALINGAMLYFRFAWAATPKRGDYL